MFPIIGTKETILHQMGINIHKCYDLYTLKLVVFRQSWREITIVHKKIIITFKQNKNLGVMRFIIIVLSQLFFFIGLNGQILINEVQSSNLKTVNDEFGNYPDWLELINTGSDTINIKKWFITDNVLDTFRWQLPEIKMAPNEPLLIFASGLDLSGTPLYWDTKIDIADEWQYVVPSDTVSDSWKTPSYSGAGWNTGKSGFGYGDNDDSTQVPNPTASIFIRKTFTIADISTVRQLLFHIDYDDGFIAYLNGVEIARENMGAAGTPAAYNQLALGLHEATMYQGGMPTEYNISDNINLLKNGNNLLAIQVHNKGATSSDLTAIPFLSIGALNFDPLARQSGVLGLKSQGLHTNFKISSEGETIMLSDSNGNFVDSIVAVGLEPDQSFGRLGNNPGVLNYFTHPTPGAINPNEGYNKYTNDFVQFSLPGGYYPGGTTVTLSSDFGDSIYYTTDGSEPQVQWKHYKTPIPINSNTVIRTRIIDPGYIPGSVYANFYYTDRQSKLNTLSLAGNHNDLFDENTGILAMGPNASNDFPHFGANFWMDWEKPLHVNYFSSTGSTVINQVAGAKVFGGWTRGLPQKSLALFARGNYGKGSFKYPVFPHKNIDKFEALVLRNTGNDWSEAHTRDAFMTSLTRHLDLDYQGFKPVSVYLNNQYWGVFNIREKVNEHYIADNRKINPDEIIMLEKQGEVINGDNTDYLALIAYLNSKSTLSNEADFDYVASQIDIDNFIKYQLVQIYCDNDDWPGNNIKYYRTTSPKSKWRYILFDTDFGFGLNDANSYNHNTIAFALAENGKDWPNPPWSTLIFRRLMSNTGFRNNFINQLSDNINTTFTPERINNNVDSIKTLIEDEMVYHCSRWGRDYNSWKWHIDALKTWGSKRPSALRNHINSHFKLSGQVEVNLTTSEPSKGKIKINSITPSLPFTGIYFNGVPINIEAIPAPGYKFVRWEGAVAHSNIKFSQNVTSKSSFTAVFEPVQSSDVNLVINEINYNSGSEFSTGDWVELYNNTNATVDLRDYALGELATDSVFRFPANTIVQPGGFLVVCKDIKRFKKVYPFIENCVGDLNFGFSSNGDEIRIKTPDLENIDAVDYLPVTPWPVEANGTGATLELRTPDLDNAMPENWIANTMGGTPGGVNSLATAIKGHLYEAGGALSVVAFPTQFNDKTSILFTLNTSTEIELVIIDVTGRVVEVLKSGMVEQGAHRINWMPAGRVSAGLYHVRLITKSNISNAKVIYLGR